MNLERTHLDAMVMTHICLLAVVNRSVGQAKHVRWDSTNCINLGVYDSLQVPNCVGSRGDALASEEATMQHNVSSAYAVKKATRIEL